MNTNKKLLRMTQMALFCALAVVIGLFKFPIIPAAPFLELDLADVPIVLGTLIFGTFPGLCILLVVSLIQAFLLGGNGWVGLVMHFAASGLMVVIVGLICRKSKTIARLTVSLVTGAVAMTAIMVPLNYIFIPILFGLNTSAVTVMVWPAIVPFNLIKGTVISVMSAVLFVVLRRFFEQNKLINQNN